jgi:hypothetical protein
MKVSIFESVFSAFLIVLLKQITKLLLNKSKLFWLALTRLFFKLFTILLEEKL